MPTRREFLKDLSGATAGIVFAGCCCADSTRAFARSPQQSTTQPSPGSKRAAVTINGQRVPVVDVQSHVRVPEACDLVKDRIARERHCGNAQHANHDGLSNILNVTKRLPDLN